MAFRVAETLGEQWQEAMGGVPLAAHFAQRQPHAAGCEVGAAGRFDHHEAAQLDDEGKDPAITAKANEMAKKGMADLYKLAGVTEQAGADQPAPKPADKPPVKDQPSTPTSKDHPR